MIDCCDTNYEPMKFLGLQSSLGEAHRVRGAGLDGELAYNFRGAGTPVQASVSVDVRHASGPRRYSRSSTRVLTRQVSQRTFAMTHSQSSPDGAFSLPSDRTRADAMFEALPNAWHVQARTGSGICSSHSTPLAPHIREHRSPLGSPRNSRALSPTPHKSGDLANYFRDHEYDSEQFDQMLRDDQNHAMSGLDAQSVGPRWKYGWSSDRNVDVDCSA